MIELPWLLYVLLGVNALGSATDAVLRVLSVLAGQGAVGCRSRLQAITYQCE